MAQQKDHLGRFVAGNTLGIGHEPQWLRSQRRVLQKKLTDAGPKAAEYIESLIDEPGGV